MPKYSADIRLYGTIYVDAPNAEAAQNKIIELIGTERDPIPIFANGDFTLDEEGSILSAALTSYGRTGSIEQVEE